MMFKTNEKIAEAPTKATTATKQHMTASEALSCYANDNTMATLSTSALNVLNRIGIGKEHALKIKNKDNNNAESRTVRMAVSELRTAGIPVVNTGDGNGYYIARPDRPDELAELKHMEAQLASRIKEIYKAKSGLSRALYRAHAAGYSLIQEV